MENLRKTIRKKPKKSEQETSLRGRLIGDTKTAVHARDQASLGTTRSINAAVKRFEVDKRTEADDAKITAILTKMVKQRKDSARIHAEAGRQNLTDKGNAETEILYRYLPQMVSTEEIQTAVAAAVAQTGIPDMADMGKVMGVLRVPLAGKVDMGEVNKILKAVLNA